MTRDGAGFQNYLGDSELLLTDVAGVRGSSPGSVPGSCRQEGGIFSKVCDVCALVVVVGVGVDEAPTQPAQLRSLV
jgi:hypothetical protein